MLTRRMQVQAVADRVAGLETTLTARSFCEPWRGCWEALDRARPGEERLALVAAMQEEAERDAILGAIFAAEAGAPLGEYPSLQEMHDEGLLPPVEWLWQDWIPLRMLSLLAGEPGVGKSMIALDLAGRIIAGRDFPDGRRASWASRAVIYVDAEDAPSIHDERSQAWGMDRARLFLMLPEAGGLFIDLNEQAARDRLVEMIHTIAPALVIVDSLSSISLRGESAKEDVMCLLAFLKRVAQNFDCAVLLIHHLRKPPPGMQARLLTMADVRGSGHIVAAARSVIGASVVQTGAEADPNGPRRLEVLKTNLTRYPRPLGINLVPLVGGDKWVFLKYGDAPNRYEEPTKADLCGDWLMAALREHGEPMKPKKIVGLAAEEGYNRRLVYRAREQLGDEIVDTANSHDPNNCWALAGL